MHLTSHEGTCPPRGCYGLTSKTNKKTSTGPQPRAACRASAVSKKLVSRCRALRSYTLTCRGTPAELSLPPLDPSEREEAGAAPPPRLREEVISEESLSVRGCAPPLTRLRGCTTHRTHSWERPQLEATTGHQTLWAWTRSTTG